MTGPETELSEAAAFFDEAEFSDASAEDAVPASAVSPVPESSSPERRLPFSASDSLPVSEAAAAAVIDSRLLSAGASAGEAVSAQAAVIAAAHIRAMTVGRTAEFSFPDPRFF